MPASFSLLGFKFSRGSPSPWVVPLGALGGSAGRTQTPAARSQWASQWALPSERASISSGPFGHGPLGAERSSSLMIITAIMTQEPWASRCFSSTDLGFKASKGPTGSSSALPPIADQSLAAALEQFPKSEWALIAEAVLLIPPS